MLLCWGLRCGHRPFHSTQGAPGSSPATHSQKENELRYHLGHPQIAEISNETSPGVSRGRLRSGCGAEWWRRREEGDGGEGSLREREERRGRRRGGDGEERRRGARRSGG
ncbi:hypothetical protein KC19_9G096600 [Ceratodon purpureus]|uniref:Uncharacterized protein n=1 Tax=Ceratodon purpureus TaxID=3225 RepID=A0A8T0GQG4_CERPU|nr:hypothetical protein KC19_9G096600 [Ceratodon purpureus]